MRPTIGTKVHQRRILFAGEQGPCWQLRFILQAGKELTPAKNQVAMQGALSCMFSPRVVSKLFVGITSGKSMLK